MFTAVTSVLQDLQYFWCKKLVMDDKVLLRRNSWLRQHCFLHLAFRNMLTEGINVEMILDDMLINETIMFHF